jgi:hypothetical protein
MYPKHQYKVSSQTPEHIESKYLTSLDQYSIDIKPRPKSRKRFRVKRLLIGSHYVLNKKQDPKKSRG